MARDDLPDWWTEHYPVRCIQGHELGPGRIIAGSHPCDCPAARDHFNRHRVVRCNPPEAKCDAAWFDPPCAYQAISSQAP